MRLPLLLVAIACSIATAGDPPSFPEGDYARGIDVSKYEGTVDWPTVAASGISFAFTRASHGVAIIDTSFVPNWQGMKANGVIRGVYQYFVPSQDPIAQADLFVAQVTSAGGFEQGDLPPVLDVEEMDKLPKEKVLANVQAWIDEVQKKTGLRPLVYASPSFWTDLEAGPYAGKDDLWIAHWRVKQPKIPSSWKTWRFWQYSDKGSVAGVSTLVDTDVFNGTVAQLREYAQDPRPSCGFGLGGWLCGFVRGAERVFDEGLPLPKTRPIATPATPVPQTRATASPPNAPSPTSGLLGGVGSLTK